MPSSGKTVVLSIFGLAVLLSGFSIWFHRRATHQAQQFWGERAAVLINKAEHVTGLEIAAAPGDQLAAGGEVVTVAGRRWQVVRQVDLQQAKGLVHLRHALLEGDNFNWEKEIDPRKVNWQWALRFGDGGAPATVVLSLDDAAVALAGSEKARSIGGIVQGLKEFIASNFPAASSSTMPEG